MNRTWAMPNKNTFTIKPIKEFIDRYYRQNSIVVDPFAGQNQYDLIFSNDLNTKMNTAYHIDSVNFLKLMQKKHIIADLIFFDPPYSTRQIKECYEGIGLHMRINDTLRSSWKSEKDIIVDLLKTGGIILSFGWNSAGIGKNRNFEIIEILLVCHGGGHYDTICVAEKNYDNRK